jgi:tRNA-dihydrouridine synthase B
MKIGNVHLAGKVILAPMAGVTDLTFRKICRKMDAGLVVSEMVSAKAMTYNNERTGGLLATEKSENPASIQIFGSDPEVMGQAAAMLNNSNFDIIDINMGCPAPKIVKNGDGSALMRDPALIGRIVKAVCAATTKPVTAKIRLGYDFANKNYLEVARIIEDSGASAITVHGRTRPQMYSGHADWEAIAQVKTAIKTIPIIGNGDITSPEDALRRLKETSVDAVMVGRGSLGNPWIFKRCHHYLETGEILPEPTSAERVEMALEHTQELITRKGEFIALREMRGHLAWYRKGRRDATEARVKINQSTTLDEVKAILEKLLSS